MNAEIWEGFRERTTMLNPIFMLGKGMEVGATLAPYLPQLLLAILLEVFYREIKDDDKRSRSDLVAIAKTIMEHQNLPHDDDKAERLISGLVSYGNPNLRNPFNAKVFDPSSGMFSDKPFLYLTIDTEYRKREAIYKLTQTSQNMIFLSREVILEFSIEFEQLYTLKLIRNNNFRSALQSLDVLITKIKQLIAQEHDYRRHLHRNPKILMEQGTQARKERRNEIERQFEESNQRFDKMIRMLANVDLATPEARFHIFEMEMKVHATMALSAKLHAELYQNIELELSIRKYRPSAFMKRRNVSFKTDIWENELLAKGIPANTMEKLLSSFFSPRAPFIYPMGLIWSEQEVRHHDDEIQEEDELEEQSLEPKETRDWSALCRYWAPVVRDLIYMGEVSLRDIPAKEWTIEALELWMIFKTDVLEVPHLFTTHQPYEDERMELIRHLISTDPFFSEIAGKTIRARFERGAPLQFFGVRISPIIISIKDPAEEDTSNAIYSRTTS